MRKLIDRQFVLLQVLDSSIFSFLYLSITNGGVYKSRKSKSRLRQGINKKKIPEIQQLVLITCY